MPDYMIKDMGCDLESCHPMRNSDSRVVPDYCTGGNGRDCSCSESPQRPNEEKTWFMVLIYQLKRVWEMLI